MVPILFRQFLQKRMYFFQEALASGPLNMFKQA